MTSLGLTGCGQGSSIPAGTAAGLPPIPADRQAAGLTEYVLDGSAPEVAGPGAQPQGTALLLDGTGGAGAARWALYRFNPGLEPPDSVSVILEQPATTGAFIGLADYTTQRWQLDGPYTAQKSFTIDTGDYISPAGNIWVAVLVPAGNTATVSALSVRTVRPDNQAPVAQFTFSRDPGTPFRMDFDASGSSDAEGAIEQYAWDFDGDGLFEGFTGSATVSRTFPHAGPWQVSLRVTDSDFAHGETTQPVAAGNLPPVAAINATPSGPQPPSTPVQLSAALSSDPDGSIAQYEWDVDGMPGFEINTNLTPTYSHFTPGNPEARRMRVRVTDNEGAQTEASVVVVAQGWAVQNMTGLTGGPAITALAIVDGRPAIAYAVNTFDIFNPPPFGTDDGTLYYTIASDEYGLEWSAPVALETSGSIKDIALVVVNGRPAVAYGVDTDNSGFMSNNKLRYCRALDAGGSGWGVPLDVDATATNPGAFADLAVIAGNPAIAYTDSNNFDLHYSRATNADGTAWGSPLTLDAAQQTGYAPSLREINSRPMVAFHTEGPTVLRFAAGTNATGSSWNAAVTLDDNAGGQGTGRDPSLWAVNGRPAVAYRDDLNQQLQYLRASDALGGSWPATPVTVDTSSNTGLGPQLRVLGGLPCISYGSEAPAQDMLLVTASNADGSAWPAAEPVDTVDNAGYYSKLILFGNSPAVLYWVTSSASLRYARRY